MELRLTVFCYQWDFGSLQKQLQIPTACNDPGLPQYQIQVPVSEIFWDPPIVAGVPNVFGYVPAVPPTVVVANINIDLFIVQQLVLANQ
jgi:hypothetical protein